MIVKQDVCLKNFEFWSGAATNANELTNEQLDQVQDILESEYPDGIDETELNDLFWFDFDTIKEWLGISDEPEEDEETTEEKSIVSE